MKMCELYLKSIIIILSIRLSNCYSYVYCLLECLFKFRLVIMLFNGQNDLFKLVIDELKFIKID